jgi:hypothetical protein
MSKKRRKGLILILVVSMIPLIGIVAAMLTANSRNLLVKVRLEALQLHADSAADSGLAWARLHPQRVAGLSPGEQVVLEVDAEPATVCTVTCESRSGAETVVQVTGAAKDRRFSANSKRTVTVPNP